ncbi:hypothetical protein DMENIID0001_139780 [Sergentomyia squamirostris]
MAKLEKDQEITIKISTPKLLRNGITQSVTSSSSSSSASLLKAYRELFAVVEKIPNVNVKTRVFNAILTAVNGEFPESMRKKQNCKCSVMTKVETKTISTQTTMDDYKNDRESASVIKDKKSPIIPIGGVVKLGRKRKTLLPQATSSSNLGVKLTKRQEQQRMLQESQTRGRQQVKSEAPGEILSKFIQTQLLQGTEGFAELLKELEDPKVTLKDDKKTTKLMMVWDWWICDKFKNGFLPIHNAAEKSDKVLLKRQCITLSNRRLGVDLKSEDGFTALHVALKNQSDDEIIEILLNYGADPCQVDPGGNNCLLLAAKHTQNLNIFKLILNKVTKLVDLQRENAQSHRIFRLIVDYGRIEFLHELIKHVDMCLGLSSTIPEGDEQQIIRHYRKILNGFSNEKIAPTLKINEQKAKMINCPDKTSGKTPLFCAVEKQKEIIVLALLANFADPRIETFFKKDCFALASEILTNKRISTALEQEEIFII